MNIRIIDNLFDKLNIYEKVIKYQYEPIIPQNQMKVPRNIYFPDLKKDFLNEITEYGFSPYIHQTSDVQQKQLKCFNYKKKGYNYGLNNYVKKKTHFIKSSLLAKSLIDLSTKSNSVKKMKRISFASNLIQGVKSKTNDSQYKLKQISNDRMNNTQTDNSYISKDNTHSKSMMTLSQVFMIGYTPKKKNEIPAKINHHPLRVIIEPKSMMNNKSQINILNDNVSLSPVVQKPFELEFIKTAKPLRGSKSLKKMLMFNASSNLNFNSKKELIRRDLFQSHKEYKDYEKLIAERHPGSIFNRSQRIRNNKLKKER